MDGAYAKIVSEAKAKGGVMPHGTTNLRACNAGVAKGYTSGNLRPCADHPGDLMP